MKNLLTLILLFLGLILYGQTDSIEKAIIYNKLLNKEIEQSEFSRIWMSWNKTLKEIKNYPELPLDQSGQIHYSFLKEFKDFNKEKLFTRILEWLSLNYGLVPSAVYSNLEDGKIIFRNSTNLSIGNTCNYASVISIKDEKIRMEFLSIGFQSYYQGHYSGDTWIPEIRINFNTDEIYPIVLKKSSEWIPLLNLLMTTDEYFNAETENLYNYITTFDYLNNF